MTSLNKRGCCPLCGAGLRTERIYYDRAMRTVIGNGHVRQLTPTQAKLFELLWPPKGSFIRAADLESGLGRRFYHAPDGTIPAIAGTAKRLRKILAPLKIEVEGSRARDRGGYRIVTPAPEEPKRAARQPIHDAGLTEMACHV